MAAHVTIHFAFGMAAGTLISLPVAMRSWRNHGTLYRALGLWIVIAWAGALWASLPSVLRHLGLPPHVATHPVMNIFLLHPFIGGVIDGGFLIGSALLVMELGTMYLALLVAIIYRSRM